MTLRSFGVVGVLALAGLTSVSLMGGWTASANLASTGQAPAASAPAATGPFTVDGVHSSVIFRIKHLNVAWNYGRFNKMSGTFLLDGKDPAKSVIDITVDASSIDTANADRDKHLRAGDFFSVQEYPTLTFKSTAFKKTGDTTFEVTGDLTMKGKTKSITITVENTGQGPGRRGGEVAGLETRFNIKRTDFGMDYMVGGLSDEVGLIIALEGGRK